VLLPEMQQAGLIGRREEPDPRDGKSRPYFIKDAGRRYLENAQQRAMGFEPNQRIGWADEVVRGNHRTVAEAIGLPAPQMSRRDAEGLGR
jgi:hypothetical protein